MGIIKNILGIRKNETETGDTSTLAYADEPESLAEYDAMVAALAGKEISFSFTLNITDNVA